MRMYFFLKKKISNIIGTFFYFLAKDKLKNGWRKIGFIKLSSVNSLQ